MDDWLGPVCVAHNRKRGENFLKVERLNLRLWGLLYSCYSGEQANIFFRNLLRGSGVLKP